MNETNRKRWRRLAAIAVVGGLAYGGWVEFIRPVTAEPVPSFNASANDRPAVEPGVWNRSSGPASHPSCPITGDVVCTGGTLPQTQRELNVSGPMVPPGEPSTPGLFPVSQISIPVGPRNYDAGLIGGATPLPTIPPVPGVPAVEPTPPMPIPPAPSESIKQVNAYGVFEMPANQPVPPIAPPVIRVPTPVMCNSSSVNFPAPGMGNNTTSNLTPAPLPIKFPDTIQPVMPIPADSGLPGKDGWLNVKMENPPVSGGVPNLPNIPAMLPVPPVGQPIIPLPSLSPTPLPTIPAVGIPGGQWGTIVDRPKASEGLLQHSEKEMFTIPVQTNPTFTPGENNMIRSPHQAAALAVLGGMFMASATPVNAAPRDDKDLTALKTQMEEATNKLKDIQKDIQKLNELLIGKKDPAGFPNPAEPGVVSQLKDLQDKLKAIDKDLDDLKKKTSASYKVQSPSTPIVEIKTGKGTVRIVNDYPIQISMVVNGTNSYKIAPGKAVDVPVPSGEFNYYLVESGGAPTKSFIKDNETVTLRIK